MATGYATVSQTFFVRRPLLACEKHRHTLTPFLMQILRPDDGYPKLKANILELILDS